MNPNGFRVRIQRGAGVPDPPPSPPPPENHKNIGFLSNTGPDPLKITKLPSQHSVLGHHQHTSETPFKFKWRFAGGLMMELNIEANSMDPEQTAPIGAV